MAKDVTIEIGQFDRKTETPATYAEREALKKWYVLWTRSHCEQFVFDQLQVKGFYPFLPRLDTWIRRGDIRYRSNVPMFPGYVLLHHVMDEVSYLEILNTRGLVRILGRGRGQLATVPDREIEAIEKTLQARFTVFPHPYLREGQRVRVTRGPLAQTEGILVQIKPKKGLLVLSVEILQRSVAVEVDCTLVERV